METTNSSYIVRDYEVTTARSSAHCLYYVGSEPELFQWLSIVPAKGVAHVVYKCDGELQSCNIWYLESLENASVLFPAKGTNNKNRVIY